MKMNTIEFLEWDSRFFGYPVARIALDQFGAEEMDGLFNQVRSEKIRLTYFFVPPDDDEMNRHVLKQGGVLVDQKTVFRKATEPHGDFINSIREFQGTAISERIKKLALQAGTFSRFRKDENFVNHEYERLYVEWITRSINKEISVKTLVAVRGADILGIITLDDRQGHAHIGLVAVDESSRGQGIGSDLIHGADDMAKAMGFKEIKVVTQLQNKSACMFYEKCGFRIERITNVYHYWQ